MQRQRQVDMRGEWSDPRRVAIMRGGWCEALLPARSMPRDDVAVVGGRHSMGRSAVGQVEGESRRCRPPGHRLKPPPPSLPLPTRRRHRRASVSVRGRGGEGEGRDREGGAARQEGERFAERGSEFDVVSKKRAIRGTYTPLVVENDMPRMRPFIQIHISQIS